MTVGPGDYVMSSGKVLEKVSQYVAAAIPRLWHEWSIVRPNAMGFYQKGSRERIYVPGQVEKCSVCSKKRFVPFNEALKPVSIDDKRRMK